MGYLTDEQWLSIQNTQQKRCRVYLQKTPYVINFLKLNV